MSAPSDFEQELLELVNRARADPQGEFAAMITDAASRTAVADNITAAIRSWQVDMALFRQQLEGLSAAAPLAWNAALGAAAAKHSLRMIAADAQSHQLPGEADVAGRIEAEGYRDWQTLGENVYSYTEDPVYGHAGFYIDWGDGPGGIQNPAGHRISMLSGDFTEIGISAVAEDNPATQVGPWVVTQNFGTRASTLPQLLGVVIGDRDGDAFYDMGEGLGGVGVTATGQGRVYQTTTWASGGYQMELPDGTYSVTFSGGGLGGPIAATVRVAGQNVKQDAVMAAGDSLAATGTGGADVFHDTAASQTIMGQGGRDTFATTLARGAVTVTAQGDSFVLTSPSVGTAGGTDRLTSVERAVFADGTLAFDLSGNAGQAYRLYKTALDRAPDDSGLGFWTRAMDDGFALAPMAAEFMRSSEFQSRYGAPDTLSNADFLTLVYANVLDRAYDQGGFDFWNGALEAGLTRESLLAQFSESAENQANVLPQIDDGIWFV